MFAAETAAGASPLELANLAGLMRRSTGRPEIMVGLIDGPVATDHPDLASARIHHATTSSNQPAGGDDAARSHGTFVAGILSARRGSAGAAGCP
jgi:subtilisin family serine protease